MRTVWVLTALGLLTLTLFACGTAARVEVAAPPAAISTVEWLPGAVNEESVQQGVPRQKERRLTPEEVRLLIHTGKLEPAAERAQVLEYTFYSRAGPRKHLKVTKNID